MLGDHITVQPRLEALSDQDPWLVLVACDTPAAFLSTGFQFRCRTGISINNNQLLAYRLPLNPSTHLRLALESDGYLTASADERADL